MKLAADLHVHTVLSPCASREMTPPAIVREASEKGIAVIAVCDHNTAGNVRAVQEAAALNPRGPAVIAGIEITTAEEAHVLGWFRCSADACAVADEVAAGLPPWRPLAVRTAAPSSAALREPEQQLMDADGKQTGIETLMLAAASRLTLSETVDLIHRHGGLSVAAHVDRRSFSVPGQLGFIPDDVPFDALEISSAGAARGRAADFLSHGLPLVSSSDCHFLGDMGSGFTLLEVPEPTFDEIAKALGSREGGRCTIA